MKEYAKLGLALMGVYLIYSCLGTIIRSCSILFNREYLEIMTFMPFLTLVLPNIIWITIVILFIKFRGKIAGWLIKTDNTPKLSPDVDWVKLSIRLTCIFSGIYFLPRLFLGTIGLLHLLFRNILISNNSKGWTDMGGYNASWKIAIMPTILLGILVIYLLCGAPHYVNWQSKKIKAALSESQEEQEL